MNKFAGTVTFEGKIIVPELPFFSLLNEQESGISVLFCLGETDLNTSKEVVEFIRSKVNATISGFDISISTEDKIEFLDQGKDIKDLAKYEMFSNKGTDFETVLRKNGYVYKVVAVREAEDDIENGGRIIKVDTLV